MITDGPFTFARIGSMFCLYFTAGPVRNLAEAMRADKPAFNRYFHACLEGGVYFAPSQFEAGFLSLAHTEEDIAETARIATAALKSVGS
jgi:glutamate-1-semialdehyde 2,1-aminomutase